MTSTHAKKSNNSALSKVNLIPQKIGVYLEELGWIYGGKTTKKGEVSWVWYQDKNGTPEDISDDFYRKFILVSFDIEERMLDCHYAVQHGLILRWQNLKPENQPRYFHMSRSIITFLSDDDLDSKHLAYYCAWKYDLKSSRKLLEARLEHLVSCLTFLGDSYFTLVVTEFPNEFFKRDVDDLINLVMYGDDDDCVPDYVLFNGPYYIPLLFASKAKDEDNMELVSTYIEKFREMENERTHPLIRERLFTPLLKHPYENQMLPIIYNSHNLEHCIDTETFDRNVLLESVP